MTWTFGNNPANSNRDLVRILVSDTNTNAQLLSDEFIDFTLSAKPSAYLAAALCAETLINSTAAATAYLASNVTRKKVGDLELSYAGGGSGGASPAQHYRELAKSLRMQAGTKVTPYSGGISVTDKAAQRDDSDRIRGFAEKDMHDHPGTNQDNQNYSDADTGWR